MEREIENLYNVIREQKPDREESLKLIKDFFVATARNSRVSCGNAVGSSASPLNAGNGNPAEKVKESLVRAASELLKVKREDIDADADLKEYGFDQLAFAEFADALNREFNLELTPALLSEHKTLRQLAGHLAAEYRDVLEKTVSTSPSRRSPGDEKPVPERSEDGLQAKAVEYFKKTLSSVIKLPAHQMEADAPMEKYGIDSVLVMQLTNHLERTFGSLPKTLFFEYQTIRALSEYFLESHRDRLYRLLGGDEPGRIADNSMVPPSAAAPVRSGSGLHRRLRTSSHRGEDRKEESGALDIAVIGLSGRYPQARTIEEFWKNLRDGKDCITEVPKERWDHSLYFDEDKNKPGKTYGKWGGFLDEVDRFDPLFFGIAPREAEVIDPQERLFLECVYETLEDSAYARRGAGMQQGLGLEGPVGVYVGVMYEEYQLYGAERQVLGRPVSLGGSPSSIANRVSYFFNFQGPSMAVDTMCSSSLTAIYLACRSLQRGECEAAIAGGVNVSVHPNKYLLLAQSRFISSNGRCTSFGEGGDGYVPGEGVGAVLLKPLAKAVADGDHIYGVIKAAAINHGGKTNGYTVPSPNAQFSVIDRAFKEARIDPRAVSYIEAHGTGTSLGDPIEIAGLNKAFREYTNDRQFCAIGSAKSNIGHCESAAGIAGVTKVLLQLKHGQLAPSLHSSKLNPSIDFSDTPFVVQQELAEWKRPVVAVNGVYREYPRIAGISSFGAGGSNAHVVIEEYIPQEPEPPAVTITPQDPAVVVLSAMNQDLLKEQAQRLLKAVHDNGFTDGSLAAIAYTLQVGREAMEERLAVIAGSIEDLELKLKSFVEGRDDVEDFYRGQVKRNKETLAVFAADEDMAKTIDAWISKRKYAKLLDLWVKGLVFDWNKLYRGVKPRRISLPTYPFARDRYWVPEVGGRKPEDSDGRITGNGRIVHPLLHQNTSNFTEQCYSSLFTGQEFFLADHVVKGEKMLPGTAYLEMARAAVEHAAGLSEEGKTIRLKNIVWARPLAANGRPVQVRIGLVPQENGEIAYEIYSRPDGNGDERVVHSQGTAMLGPDSEVAILDIRALQEQCNQDSLSSSRCYEAFKAMGIEYGPGHRGIEHVFIGSGQVLAKLALPTSVSGTQDRFILHPSLMDSALQASIGLTMRSDSTMPSVGTASLKPVLPFALQEIEIIGRCPSTMWALIRRSNGSKPGDKVQKLDIDVCDELGNVCVRMRGFSSRALEGDRQTGIAPTPLLEPTSEPLVGAVLLTPVWEVFQIAKAQAFPDPSDLVVIVGGDADVGITIQQYYPKVRVLDIRPTDTIDAIAQKLEAQGSIDHILWIAPHHPLGAFSEEAVLEDQNRGVLCCFRTIKALLGLEYGSRALGWSVITVQAQSVHKQDAINPAHASLHGLIGSMAKEYPNWKVRLIDWEAGRAWTISDIASLPTDSYGNACAYRAGEWYRQKLLPVRYRQHDKTAYRSGGVYVVIGGAGGIGEAWSEYMIRAYQARIVWIGRRPKDAGIQAKLDRLANRGAAPRYIAADAADRSALQRAYEEIKENYSQIHGVIHAAIVLLDKSLANMDEDRFKTALSAKIDVSARMSQVFKNEPLDFVLFFSSLNAFVKAAGQSNYAAGCTFKDAFARALSQQWSCPAKVMNWGYWGSVGIVASKEYQERMARAGIGSIEPSEAMEALERLLSGPVDQLALVKTTNPLSLEEIDSHESIGVYPEALHPAVRDVQGRIPEKDPRAQRIKSEMEPRVKTMHDLLCRLLWRQLRTIGMFAEKRTAITDLKAKASPLYERWVEASIAFLERMHYLRCEGSVCSVFDPAGDDGDAAWKQWDRHMSLWREDSELKAQAVLADAMLRALPDILTGKAPATDIMFPNSSLDLVEGVYRNTVVSDYFNEALADALVAYIQERILREPSVKIRILEIGAGTGGTSASVFRKLKPHQDHIGEYCYTDISKAFLLYAQKTYGPENPYLSYKTFNVEEPVAGQGIEAAGYDVVVATNVLHATRNIRRTLRNAKAVLRRNGLILLNEISSSSLFTHLTFGLLEGWWLYEDAGLRIPGCPGLYPETWQSVLGQEGYRSVSFLVRDAHDLGQQIIAAESDGIVRQRQKTESGEPVAERKGGAETTDGPRISDRRRPKSGEIIPAALRELSTEYIKKMVAETLKMPSHGIDPSEPLERYGLDSILIVQLTNALSAVLKDVNTTLFFEHQTIDALVDHFMKTQKASLIALAGLEDRGDDGKVPRPVEAPPERQYPQSRRLRPRTNGRLLPASDIKSEEAESDAFRVRDAAVIGLAGRYPQANNVHEFWNNLKAGKNCITEIPRDRWDWKKYFDEEKGKKGSMYTRWGGFLPAIDKFDPLFFHISPLEAEQMDPQERLFLETVYASIGDAGYTPATLCDNRKIGVFVGVMNGNYSSGSSYWSIANRVSYLFNFQGPSIAVDTACSSSLTAIHLAMESLSSGNSECAVAGGVNLIVSPVHFMKLSAMAMLSRTDQCRSFGDEADGFVDGEGVGAVVLKPLHKAVADGDHIYGVIKGSALNAGGKTSGYTVPNPAAQFQLVAEALRRAGVHARTISYIEAHGTGTALGDPIEIAGLTRVFEQDTGDKQFCAIGSAKSNIGHCESAAGIAGVTKVLLQMKHRQLAPSLHSRTPNPNIDFGKTPFVIQQELAEWKQPVAEIDGEVREYPRRAGVSSFGAGGANAHVLLEEYEGPAPATVPVNGVPQIIILSARNEDRLRAYARVLHDHLAQNGHDISLMDIAYTLQTGREAMEVRLAVVSSSVEELCERLSLYCKGKEDIENLWRGNIKEGGEQFKNIFKGEAAAEFIRSIIQNSGFAQLAALWVSGTEIDWRLLHPSGGSKRISLPTYPFAGERYWLRTPLTESSSAEQIHPLIDTIHYGRTLNQEGIVFQKILDSGDVFAGDYKLRGRSCVPGTVLLEMALAACETVIDGAHVSLGRIACLQPLSVEEGKKEVNILVRAMNGQMEYKIQSENNDHIVIHAQGELSLNGKAAEAMEQRLDIEDIKTRCDRQIDKEEFYAECKKLGTSYGPYFQVLSRVWGNKEEALALLNLPPEYEQELNRYILHPALMEGAFQAIFCLVGGLCADGNQPLRPFVEGIIEMLRPLKERVYVYVKNADKNAFDATIADESGAVCLKLGRVSFSASSDPLQDFFYAPAWKELPFLEKQAEPTAAEEEKTGKRTVLIIHPPLSLGLERDLAAAHAADEVISIRLGSQTIRQAGGGWEARTEDPLALDSCIKNLSNIDILYYLGGIQEESISDGDLDSLEQSQERGVLSLFRTVKSLSVRGFAQKSLSLKVIASNAHCIGAGETVKPYAASVLGLAKSTAKEFPGWRVTCIDIDEEEAQKTGPGKEIRALVKSILEEPGNPQGDEVVIRNGKRYARVFEPVGLPPVNQSPFTQKGVYLILGGAGGIGLELSGYLVESVQARLALIGRSGLDDEKKKKISQIESRGGKLLYIQADAADIESMKTAVEKTRSRFGRINGIIHSAIVLEDKTLRNMDEEGFRKALDPKVKGSVVLHKALQGEKPDFMMFFSSLASFTGNPGQGNYVAGCAFKDAFANYLGRREPYPVKAVNWGYWGSAGIAAADGYRKRMADQGLLPIEPHEGMEAIRRILASTHDQIISVKLNHNGPALMEDPFKYREGQSPEKDRHKSASRTAGDTKQWLREIISEGLKIPMEKIDDGTAFADLGIDSVIAITLVKKLEERFESKMDPSILMKYPSVSSLSEHLNRENTAAAPEIRTADPDHREPVDAQDPLPEHEQKGNGREISDAAAAGTGRGAFQDGVDKTAGHAETDRPPAKDDVKHRAEEVERSLGRLFTFWGQALLAFFREQNIFTDQRPVGRNALKNAMDCHPRYDYMVEVFLDILQRAGLIQVDADSIGLTAHAMSAEVQASVEKLNSRTDLLIRALPDLKPHFSLFAFCRKHYREILSGRTSPEILLDSPGGRELVRDVYKGNHRLSLGTSDALSEHLKRHLENHLDGGKERISILEIGAGTMSFGNAVLDTLEGKAERVEYYHSDKPSALSRLKREIGRQAHPFVHFHEIDAQDIEKQEPEKFHIIIVRTVVSDVDRLRRALHRIERACDNNSLIIIGQPLEADFLSLTFGLLDEAWSWRSFLSDARLSPESNVQWRQALRKAGYAFEEAFGQRLIIARRDAGDAAHRTAPESDHDKNTYDSPGALNTGSTFPAAARQEEALLHRRIFTTSLGHHLEYFTYGQGEPIVFLTALAFTHAIWKRQIGHFQQKNRLIFPHILPGHAGSTFAGKRFTFEELAEDLTELLDRLELHSVHLLGWCMAGNVAQLFTLRHPRRVNTLTLVCTTPTDARVRGLASQDLKTYSVDPLAVYELEFQNIYQQRYYSDKNIGEYLDAVRKSSCRVHEEAMLHHMYGVFEFDSAERLKEISAPTLVMSGRWDIAFPPDQVRLLHRGIAGSEFIEFEMAGHMPFLNQHALFNAALEDFLARRGEREAGRKGLEKTLG